MKIATFVGQRDEMRKRWVVVGLFVWLLPAYGVETEWEEAEQRKFDYFFYEGLKWKNGGKQDEAFEAFRHCLAIDSTDAALAYELAFCYAQMDKPQDMFAWIRKAVAANPENFTYRWVYASVAHSLGYKEEAVEAFRELVKRNPRRLALNRYLAEALAEQEAYEEAIRTYNTLESGVGMQEEISLQKYRLYMQLNDKEAAFEEIERLAAHFPHDIRYPLLLGDLYLEAGDLPRAYESYQRADAISPDDPYFFISLSNYHEAAGNHALADSCLKAALIHSSLAPETKVDILSRYLVRSRIENDGDAAISLLDTLILLHPETTNFRLMCGSLHAMRGNSDEAFRYFHSVTEMEPDNLAAWQNLLRMAFNKEDADEIFRICSTCIRLFPDNPEYYFYLGFHYYQRKDYAEALRTLHRGVSTVPETNPSLKAEFYGQIGDSYQMSGQLDSAFAAYEKAIALDGNNISVLNNYAYFLSLSPRELDRAERMSALTIKAEPNNATYLDTYAWIFFVKGDYRLALLYIERAVSNDKTQDPELFDHYGDILFFNNEPARALEQWKRAREAGKETPTLLRKIKEERYIEISK
jgi:tetratricopeptide (TPR) repeat protein